MSEKQILVAKGERTVLRRKVTRKINSLKQMLAEIEAKEVVQEEIRTLKEENICDHLCDIDDDAKVDEHDEYFFQEQAIYVEVLEKANVYVSETKVEPNIRGKDPVEDISREELMLLLNMPKLELDTFSGDPLEYYQFIQAFEQNVVTKDPDMKLSRLVQYTRNEPHRIATESQIIGGQAGLDEALNKIECRFGNKQLVTERFVQLLRQTKSCYKPNDIQKLADDASRAYKVLKKLGTSAELESQQMIRHVAKRLPSDLQAKWYKVALDSLEERDSYPVFEDLVKFLKKWATRATDPIYGRQRNEEIYRGSSTGGSSHTKSVHTTSASSNSGPSRGYGTNDTPCVLCKSQHRLWHCEKFRSMKVPERLSVVNKFKLCHNCFRSSHETKDCGKKSVCAVAGCNQKHSMYVHMRPQPSTNATSEATPNANDPSVAVRATMRANTKTYMPIVEIEVAEVRCFALLDAAASDSFCSSELVAKIGVEPKVREEYKLLTLYGTVQKSSKITNLSVTGPSGYDLLMKKVYIVDQIPVKTDRIDLQQYPHLNDLNITSADTGNVDVIIGLDNADVLIPLDTRQGKKGEPFAELTKLGWVIKGKSSTGDKLNNSVLSNYVNSFHTCKNDICKLYQLENNDDNGWSQGWSQDDQKVISLWEEKSKLVENHYVVPIPWKDPHEAIPNNFGLAKGRLDFLVKKLQKQNLSVKV